MDVDQALAIKVTFTVATSEVPAVELLVQAKNVLRDEVLRLREERRWIPCGERLPEYRGDVLVLTGNGVGIAWYSPKSKGGVGWNSCYLPDKDPRETLEAEIEARCITHWQPLPEGPG